MCDACSTKPITGTRYKCVRCPDYDLCGACFDLGTRHPHGFVNVQIPKHPDRVKPPTGATLTHLGVICDGCKAFVKGIRYKCGNCLNFDLCAACEENMNHDPTHIFLKIRNPIAWSPMDHLLPSLYDPNPPLKVVYGKDNLSFVRAYTSLQEKGTDVSAESKRSEKTELQTSIPECQAIDLMADKVPEPILAEAMDCSEAPPAHEGEGHVPKSTATEGRSSCMKQDDEPEIVSSAECSGESSEDECSNDEISTVEEPMPDRTRKEMLQAIGKTQLPRCPTDDGDGNDNSSDTSESSESSTTEEESSESGEIVGTAYASEILEGPLGSIVVKPRQPIKKSWIVKNTGTCTWPCNSPLVLVAGDLTAGRPVLVKKIVRPGERVRIDMAFRAPKQIGTYSSYYRMCAPYSSNFVFGTYLECRFTVCDTEQSNLRSTEESKSSSPSSTDSRASSVPMDSASSSTATGTILMEDSCTIEFPSPACSWPYSDSDNDQSDPPISNGHESDDDETMEIVSVSSRDSRSVE